MRHIIRQQNKGFSLVELIVSIAILAIVAAAIIAFFSVSMRQYKTNTDEASLQTESQLTWKRLESNILMANEAIWTSSDHHEIDLYNDNAEGRTITKIKFPAESNENCIEYVECDEAGTPLETQIFAGSVKDFTVRMYNKDGALITKDQNKGDRPVKVDVHIEYIIKDNTSNNDRTYTSDNTVALRNSVVATDQVWK